MQKILEDLYIGNANDMEQMDGSVEVVLNLRRTDYQPPAHVVTYERIPWLYLEDSEHFDKLVQAVRFVEHNHLHEKKRIMVHCNVGVDRTLGVVTSYLIYLGFSLEEAYDYLKSLKLDLPREPVDEVKEAIRFFATSKLKIAQPVDLSSLLVKRELGKE